MELHGWWVKLLQDSCYYGEKIEINNFYDMFSLLTDDNMKNAYKKFRKLPEELIVTDIKRIHKNRPFNENVLTNLQMRNPLFSKNLFLEGREI